MTKIEIEIVQRKPLTPLEKLDAALHIAANRQGARVRGAHLDLDEQRYVAEISQLQVVTFTFGKSNIEDEDTTVADLACDLEMDIRGVREEYTDADWEIDDDIKGATDE